MAVPGGAVPAFYRADGPRQYLAAFRRRRTLPEHRHVLRRRQPDLGIRRVLLRLQIPAVQAFRRAFVQPGEGQSGDQAEHRAGQMVFPGHALLLRQHREHHAAEEEQCQQQAGQRAAVAPAQALGDQEEHQADGDAAGADVVAAQADEPGAQARTEPDHRPGAKAGTRIQAAGDAAEHQDGERVRAQVAEVAVQQRRGQHAGQSVQALRADGQGLGVEQAVLGEERRAQQRHPGHGHGQCPVELRFQPAHIGGLLGGVQGFGVHGFRDGGRCAKRKADR